MPEHFTNEISVLEWSNISVFMQDATWALFYPQRHTLTTKPQQIS